MKNKNDLMCKNGSYQQNPAKISLKTTSFTLSRYHLTFT